MRELIDSLRSDQPQLVGQVLKVSSLGATNVRPYSYPSELPEATNARTVAIAFQPKYGASA